MIKWFSHSSEASVFATVFVRSLKSNVSGFVSGHYTCVWGTLLQFLLHKGSDRRTGTCVSMLLSRSDW
jgi:hypothetical protein